MLSVPAVAVPYEPVVTRSNSAVAAVAAAGTQLSEAPSAAVAVAAGEPGTHGVASPAEAVKSKHEHRSDLT